MPTPDPNQPWTNPQQATPNGPLTPTVAQPGQSFGPPQPNTGINQELSAPITNEQQAAAFVDPNAQANYGEIAGMGAQALTGYGPGGSSLAGITQLGAVTQANAPTIATNQSQALLGGQVANINALSAQAQGQGPSPATVAAQQQTQANIAAEMAMVGSQRGSSNSALGLRAAQDAGATAMQQGVQAAVAGKTQEELAAQQQLTGALGGTQGQVQQGAQAQAALTGQAALANAGAANASTLQQGSMNQQTALANLQAQLQAGQINMQEYNAQVQAIMAQSNTDFAAQQNYANLVTGANLTLQGEANRLSVNATNNMLGTTSAGIAGGAALGAGALAASDRRLKTGVTSGARGIREFLSALSASSPRSGFALLGDS